MCSRIFILQLGMGTEIQYFFGTNQIPPEVPSIDSH